MSNVRNMTAKNSVTVLAVALAALACANAFGSSIVGFTDGGNFGGHVGATGGINIGREFTVISTGHDATGITVSALGAFADDATGNPITFTTPHTVSLFEIGATGVANPTNTLIASVIVPAGTSAPFEDGFRFASLSTPVYLPAGNYAVIAYGLNNGNEGYGDGGAANNTANFHNVGFDPYVLPTAAVSPTFPTNGDTNHHNGASLIFSATPEPSSFILGGLGVVGLLLAARRRRKA